MITSTSPVTALKSYDHHGTAGMFNSIATTYDFLNHFLSAGFDRYWRLKAVEWLACVNPRMILDVATGTGDMAILAAAKYPGAKITGLDPAIKMLEIARSKIRRKNLSGTIELISGSSENIPFHDDYFDGVMVAFGVRNYSDVQKGLAEMHRVLKKNGKAVILEFSLPEHFPLKQVYSIYFNFMLPVAGRIVSRNSTAYSYLPSSVANFPDRHSFISLLRTIGFSDVQAKTFTGGIVTVYSGIK